MASHTPDTLQKPDPKYLYAVGMLLMSLGVVLLLLPVLDRALRPAGAAALLLGVVMVGSYFMRRLMAEMSGDQPALEPAWRKPAHGSASLGSLPVAGGRAMAPPDPAAVIASPISTQATQPPGPVWGPEVFEHMSPQQFVAVCEALFAQGGFETRCQSDGASGGVTIWLHSRHAQHGTDSPAAVALCRQWLGQPVGVREMRPLLELMGARQLQRGTYATSSSYTEKARKFAKDNNINALDGAGLLGLIARRTPGQQQALLALALDNH